MLLFDRKDYQDPSVSPAGPEPKQPSPEAHQRNAALVAEFQA